MALVASVIRVKLDELLQICDYEIQTATAKAAQVGLSVPQQAYWTAYAAQVANAKTELLAVYDVAP
jgi:hypothetical protein